MTDTRATGVTGRTYLVKGEQLSEQDACAIYRVKPAALIKRMVQHGTIDEDLWAKRKGGGKPSSPTAYAENLQALYDVVENEPEKPMSVRRAYYRAGPTAAAVPGIGKTENDYGKVSRMLTDMRRGFNDGGTPVVPTMPHEWIEDTTRQVDKVATWPSVGHFKDDVPYFFRMDFWKDRDAYVEVWAEKDVGFTALTDKYRVPLAITHGQISEGFLYESAKRLSVIDRRTPIYIFHIGDHDPAGDSVVETNEWGLLRIARQYKWAIDENRLHYVKLALTSEQVLEWDIPLRPTKGSGGKMADDWEETHGSGSAELDAIEPSKLVALIEEAINLHMTEDELEAMLDEEEKVCARLVKKFKKMKW